MPTSAPAEVTVPRVEVRRSARRRRTATAYRDRDVIVVLLPARVSHADEPALVTELVGKLLAGERRRAAPATADELQRRAEVLAERYLTDLDGLPRPTEVRWVTNQNHRWGSCTPSTGVIRLSHRLQAMPTWVADYVLLHELAHLCEPGHTPAFRRLVERYPQAARAEGFLEGFSAASAARPSEPSGGPGAAPPAGGHEGGASV